MLLSLEPRLHSMQIRHVTPNQELTNEMKRKKTQFEDSSQVLHQPYTCSCAKNMKIWTKIN